MEKGMIVGMTLSNNRMEENSMRQSKNRFFPAWLFLLVAMPLFAQNAYVRTTTNANPWVDSGAKAGSAWSTTANYFTIDTNTKYQTIQGFGGCFCEMGWDALEVLSAAGRDSVIRALFDTSGLNYTFCRLPIGANDFTTNDSVGDASYYSLDDVSGDYGMTHFSLRRDSVRIIPFVKAAQAYKPNLRFWASPWTPPAWLKDNTTARSNYAGGHLKDDATTYAAYALYLSKTVREFKKVGINIEYITCQNEPEICATTYSPRNYPTCCWTNTQQINFYQNYMIPRFNTDSLLTKIIVGVYCCVNYSDWVTPFMNNSTIRAKVGVISHSYQAADWGAQAWTDYPGVPFFETEADWGWNGAHDWNQGITQWNSMIRFLTTGHAVVFEQWNMILNQNYSSHWGFAQSAPININTSTKAVTYEPHYWAIKHIEHFVQAGAKAVKMTATGTSPGTMAAFKNPNGDIIVVCSDTGAGAFAATIRVGNTMWKATFPAKSFNTLRIAGGVTAVSSFVKGPQNLCIPALSNARINNSTLYFTLGAGAQEVNMVLTDLQGRTIWTGHAAIHGKQQAFAIRPIRGGLLSGTCLLTVKIKNSAGVITTVENKVAAVD
jgi:glucosylceramidase